MRPQRLSVYLITAILCGCGFQPRGMMDMPSWLTPVAVIIHEGHRELATALTEQLQAYNISVSAEPTLANYWLIIENDTLNQQITSVSASTTPRQYQLGYQVQFSLVSARGKVIIPPSLITVNRQLTVNNDRILGSNFEKNTLTKEMQHDAALQIVNRISRK